MNTVRMRSTGRDPYDGGMVAMDKRGKVQLPKLKFLVGVTKKGKEVVRDDKSENVPNDDRNGQRRPHRLASLQLPLGWTNKNKPLRGQSTNRSLPASYGSSLQPINQRGQLVQNGHDPYTAYQSDRARGRGHGGQYSVIKDGSDQRLNRGASSAPGHKKPDRSRPLPKINNLVKARAPDPLEKHLRQSSQRAGYENDVSHDPSQHNGLPQTDNDETVANEGAEPERFATHHQPPVKSSHNPSNVHQSSKFKPYPSRNNRERSSTPPRVPEHIISPPKSGRTIYFGPTYGQTTRSKSKMQDDRDDHIRRQLALGHSTKGGILRNKSGRSKPGGDMATTTSFRTDREGTKSIIVPRRERTRIQVNRARSELISRAKTKDDVRLRRTRNFNVVPTTQGTRKEKIDRDIYKLEEQMKIYLQMNGMSASAVEFDAMSRVSGNTFATSRASSPAKKKRNPYTDPKRAVPPWHRKEYILNQRESQMYHHISKVYGNEKLRQNRENAFYKKVEALQLEEWNRLWDEYERKIRERDNKRKKQHVQLQHVRDKFTEDRWERIAKFPVNRIPVRDGDDPHEYGLPKNMNENPDEYIPRVGAANKPKETFDSDRQTVKNVKRFHPIFQGYRGGPGGKHKHAPKMEGVDVVVLSDEEGDEDEVNAEGKRVKKKRVKVDALVREAENAVEGASDESEWEDIEDAEDLHNRLRKGEKTPAGRQTNRSRVGFAQNLPKSTSGPASTKPTPSNSRLGVYNTNSQPRKLKEKSTVGKPASQSRNAPEPTKATQDAYKPVGKSRFKPTVGDFRSGLDREGTQKQATSMDGKKLNNKKKPGTGGYGSNVDGEASDNEPLAAGDKKLQSESKDNVSESGEKTDVTTGGTGKGRDRGEGDTNTGNVTTGVQDNATAPHDQAKPGDGADMNTKTDGVGKGDKESKDPNQGKDGKTGDGRNEDVKGKNNDKEPGTDDIKDETGQTKSTKKVEFDTNTTSKKAGAGGRGGVKPQVADNTADNAKGIQKPSATQQAGVPQKDENVRGSKQSLIDKSGLSKRRGSKVSLLDSQGITVTKTGKDVGGEVNGTKGGKDAKDTGKDTNAEKPAGADGKDAKGKDGPQSKIAKRDSKLSIKGDAVSRDNVTNGDVKATGDTGPTSTDQTDDRGNVTGEKDTDGKGLDTKAGDQTNGRDASKDKETKQTTKKDSETTTTGGKDSQGTSKDKDLTDRNNKQKSITTNTTKTTTTTKTGKAEVDNEGKGTDQDREKQNADSAGQEQDDTEGKENQQPKKQVRIISPEKTTGKSTRAVSPGVGKNRGGYKAPKKFEITKSEKGTTRAQSPSLFQKGLYNEPDKFDVRKSDKALTKAEGPDLGHGEYNAPKPFETTKTERFIRGRSPFGPREKRSKTELEPESYRRRTERTEKTERKIRETEPKRTSRVRNYNAEADDEGDEPRSRPVRGGQPRHEDTTVAEPRRPKHEPERGGRRIRTETTETKTIRRRRPGNAEEDDEEDTAGRQTTPHAKKRTVRKTSPRRRKESKSTKPAVPAASQDHNRPDIPTPELDTSDDEDDIFERAKRKYGIVLDSD